MAVPRNSVAAVANRIERRLLPLFLIGQILMQIDRSNVSFAAVHLEEDLGLTPELYGFAAGIFFIGYVVFQIPSNLALQRVAANRWLGGILLGWAVVTTLQAFVQNAETLVAARFVLGVFEGGFVPGVLFLVTLWLPREHRTRASAIVTLAAPLGAIIGGPLAGTLLSLSIGDFASWQTLFLVEGVITVIYGIIFIAVVPKDADHARWLSPAERTVLADAFAADGPVTTERRSGWQSFLAAVRSGRVWIYAIAYFILSVGYYGIQFWLPQLIKKGFPDVTPFQTGIMSAIPFICAIVLIAIVGQTAQRTGDRRWHLVVLGFAAGICLVLSVVFPSPLFAFAALCVAVACGLAYIAVFWASPISVLSTVVAVAGIAFINSIANIGGFVGPYIAGVLTGQTGDFARAIIFFALALAAAGVLPLLFRKSFPSKTNDRLIDAAAVPAKAPTPSTRS